MIIKTEQKCKEYNPKMEKITTILAVIAAIIIGVIVIYLVGKFAGVFPDIKMGENSVGQITQNSELNVEHDKQQQNGFLSDGKVIGVPQVTGRSYAEASSTLKDKGYEIDIYCEFANVVSNKFKVFDNFSINKDKYLAYLNKENYDFIISSRFGLKFSEIKADIYTIHSHSDFYSQKKKFGIFYNFLRPKNKKIQKERIGLKKNKEAYFIFCSNQLKEDYCSLCNIKKSYVLYPYPNYIPKNKEKNKKNDIYTFGISALGFQNKGGFLVLKSAFLLKLIGKKFKLKMIYKEKAGFLQLILINLLGLKKYVEFIPKQENMNSFYESIDCLILASKLESFGMVGIEAIAYDLPVIVSSNCGVKELLEENYKNYIFDFSKNKIWSLFIKMKEIMEEKNNINLNINFNTMDLYNKKLEEFIER